MLDHVQGKVCEQGSQCECVALRARVEDLVGYLRTLRDNVTTAREWTTLAKIIDPEAKLRIPSRFILPAKVITPPSDIDAIKASIRVARIDFLERY